jgi:purine-binding chemotaxis protein CheW
MDEALSTTPLDSTGSRIEAVEGGRAVLGTDPSWTALLLPVDREWYALPAREVREVVREPSTVRLPTAPSLVVGVFNLRGEVVPLLDTSLLLGLGKSQPAAFAVVVDSSMGPVGLSASAVPRCVQLGEAVDQSRTAGTAGTFRFEERAAVLLDIEGLVALMRPDS